MTPMRCDTMRFDLTSRETWTFETPSSFAASDIDIQSGKFNLVMHGFYNPKAK